MAGLRYPRKTNPPFAGMGGGILEALGGGAGQALLPNAAEGFGFDFGGDNLPDPIPLTVEADNPTGLGLGEMIQPTTSWAGNPLMEGDIGGMGVPRQTSRTGRPSRSRSTRSTKSKSRRKPPLQP